MSQYFSANIYIYSKYLVLTKTTLTDFICVYYSHWTNSDWVRWFFTKQSII